jgi:hypothetical protein
MSKRNSYNSISATPNPLVSIDTVTNNGKLLVFIIFGIVCL